MAELNAQQRGHLKSDQILITLQPDDGQRRSQERKAMERRDTVMRVVRLDAYGIDQPSKQSPEVMGNVLLGNPTQNIQVKNLHFEFLYSEQASGQPASDNLELTDAAGVPCGSGLGHQLELHTKDRPPPQPAQACKHSTLRSMLSL